MVDEKIYEKYNNICTLKNIDKSSVLEKSIIGFISENYEIDTNKTYIFKYSDEMDVVKITRKDNEYLILSNGNRLNIFDFEKMYKEEDLSVINVLKELGGVCDNVDPSDLIEPDFLNNTCISEKIVDKIKNIDENNIIYDISEKNYSETIKEIIEPIIYLSLQERLEINNRIGEKKPLISNNMKEVDLIDTLSYIFSTTISFEIVNDELSIIHIDEKFHNYIELNNILDSLFTESAKYQYKK